MALKEKAGSTLEKKGHGEARGAICPDDVGLAPGGEEGRVDRYEVEHGTEGGQRLKVRLKAANFPV